MKSELRYVARAKKDLYNLDKSIYSQILKKLEALLENSELGKPLSNKFKNQRSLHVGDYRVIYIIKNEFIYIMKVGHRKIYMANILIKMEIQKKYLKIQLGLQRKR